MHNDFFRFKQFVIRHGQCAMKVGTDGVLLGAWAGVEGVTRALDVGAGSGLIAIMLAQRTHALIDAVEIDQQACAQAMENVRACPWGDRIKIHHASFQDFAGNKEYGYDLIVSNPPFHKEDIKPLHPGRRMARHSGALDYKTIIEHGAAMLNTPGKLDLILPANDEDSAMEQGTKAGLFCSRITRVIPASGKSPVRVLLEFCNQPAGCKEDRITIEKDNRNEFTPEYMTLTRDFYLKF